MSIFPKVLPVVVVDTTKVDIFKQITTSANLYSFQI